MRPSKIDGAKHAAAVIKLLVTRLRQAWPARAFIVRADSGFCRQRLLHWCERSGVGYIVGRLVTIWDRQTSSKQADCEAPACKIQDARKRLAPRRTMARSSQRML